MCDRRRVVVTGFGLATPVGLDEAAVWRNMLAGKHGIRRLTLLDPDEFKSKNGAEVDSGLLAEAIGARNIRPSGDRGVDLAMLSAAQALESASIPAGCADVRRNIAVIVGSGGGTVCSVEEAYRRYAEGGLKAVRPTTVVRIINNAISSQISITFRLTGPNYVITSACTSSSNAIGTGMRMIRDGYADTVLCGGTDSLFLRSIYCAWDKIGAMSVNPEPDRASRPFDRDRDGFVMGEGAGMLILEARDKALARGARIRGEVSGYGESSDAEHITRPSQAGQAAAMRAALDDAGVNASEIGFINAHGTGTAANDTCESMSLHEVFGSCIDRVPVASNKSFFGHLMGASGVVEAIVTLLGLEAGVVPGNLNLDNPDPACNLNLVPPAATGITSPVALKNSFGFGGNNAVLVLRRHCA